MPNNARVRYEPDGTVTITVGKVELGQGITTALAQIAAEELGVDLKKIRMVPASTAHSPDEGVTSGSQSVSEGGKALRLACAEARGERRPESGARVVGTSVPRLDLPGKFAGRPSFVQDMRLPGMLHARVVRPPHGFRKLLSLDVSSVNTQIVRDGSFVGVLAEREEDAIAAASKLRTKSAWEKTAPVPDDIHAWLKQHVTERIVSKEIKKDVQGARKVRASYTKPYIAHASIGPSCALARWIGGKLEVWTHSQGIFNLRQDLAKVLRMKEEDIVVAHAEGAGCYGHNGADDVALDAALLGREANGRPVRLQWMRDDEFAWEPYGAAMAFELEAALDASGAIVSWRHEFWSNGHTHRPGRAALPVMTAAAHLAQPFEIAPAVNPPLPAGGADRNAIPAYDFPGLQVVNHYVKEMPLRSSSLRSLGAFGNVFAIESFMDECALAAAADPLQFRLKHLKDPRGRAVLEKLAPLFKSFQKSEGRGRGIGFARYKNIGAYCAVLAEVDATGKDLRVARLVAAVDVGFAVNPDGVANQIEGGCIQAASWTLKEAMRPGAVSWEDYPILKFSEVPAVSVLLLESDQPSLGAGECTMGPVAAAIANALHDALGVRVRDLPLTPERIAAAI